MPRTKRTKYTYWSSKEPITDVFEALELLTEHADSFEPTHLHKDETVGWEIILPWFRDGDSGGAASGDDYYQVEQRVAEELRTLEYVTPLVVKEWGYSRTDRNKLVISSYGRHALTEYFAAQKTKAESFLKPGIHTDLTAELPYLHRNREHWRTGALYFDFKVPNGDEGRIYPERNEIIYPYPPKQAEKKENSESAA